MMSRGYYNPRYNPPMLEFGKYTLKYKPPADGPDEHTVAMSIASDATLPQMLRFFESFLKAVGYELGDKELCLERSAPDFSDVPEKWAEGVNWYGKPIAGVK